MRRHRGGSRWPCGRRSSSPSSPPPGRGGCSASCPGPGSAGTDLGLLMGFHVLTALGITVGYFRLFGPPLIRVECRGRDRLGCRQGRPEPLRPGCTPGERGERGRHGAPTGRPGAAEQHAGGSQPDTTLVSAEIEVAEKPDLQQVQRDGTGQHDCEQAEDEPRTDRGHQDAEGGEQADDHDGGG